MSAILYFTIYFIFTELIYIKLNKNGGTLSSENIESFLSKCSFCRRCFFRSHPVCINRACEAGKVYVVATDGVDGGNDGVRVRQVDGVT